MNDMKMRNMLNRADFSKETDLKERLRTQLFGAKIVAFPSRRQLADDDLAYVNAAGVTDNQKMPKMDTNEKE